MRLLVALGFLALLSACGVKGELQHPWEAKPRHSEAGPAPTVQPSTKASGLEAPGEPANAQPSSAEPGALPAGNVQ
jgi:predicted small lipoprotein YifL